MILETTLHSSVDRPALDLSDLHLESSLEVAGGDEGDGGGGVARPGVNVHVVSSVAATDDGHRGSSRHHEPEGDQGIVSGGRRQNTNLSVVHWWVSGSGWDSSISTKSSLCWQTSVDTFSIEMEH